MNEYEGGGKKYSDTDTLAEKYDPTKKSSILASN